MTTTFPAAVPAGVPELDSERVEARRQHLVSEASRQSRPRYARRRRPVWFVSGVAAIAGSAVVAGVVVAVVGVAGPATSNAFAGWTAKPSPIPSSAASVLHNACQQAQANGTLTTVVAEQRGPVSLAALAGRNGALVTCVRFGSSLSVRRWVGPNQPVPSGQATQYFLARTVRLGQQYTLIEGRAANDVGGVHIVLGNGTTVTASLGPVSAAGRAFVAWWPGAQPVRALKAVAGH
jgi:hypothetical protein